MSNQKIDTIFKEDVLKGLFHKDLSNEFFDALYGDAEEGAYDISLKYKGFRGGELDFEFHLKQRPGKCLVCSLTYGLPDVFSRHPIIDVKGLVKKIDDLLDDMGNCSGYSIGRTLEISQELHIIPLTVKIAK